jgi:hypothetical protein
MYLTRDLDQRLSLVNPVRYHRFQKRLDISSLEERLLTSQDRFSPVDLTEVQKKNHNL